MALPAVTQCWTLTDESRINDTGSGYTINASDESDYRRPFRPDYNRIRLHIKRDINHKLVTQANVVVVLLL